MRIYTRTGDEGDTGLFGGGRVSKAHARVEAYGDVDELNACIGNALVALDDATLRARLVVLQHDLFTIGAHLATPPVTRGRAPTLPAYDDARIEQMERWMDEADAELPELRAFILPGGSAGGAALHLARTVCRRAERRVVALAQHESVDAYVLVYLNRLSDLLFVLARLANARAGAPEQTWQPRDPAP